MRKDEGTKGDVRQYKRHLHHLCQRHPQLPAPLVVVSPGSPHRRTVMPHLVRRGEFPLLLLLKRGDGRHDEP